MHHGNHDMQILKTDIVQELIISSLKESRVKDHNGNESVRRQTGRHGERVFFGNPDVKKAVGIKGLKRLQA